MTCGIYKLSFINTNKVYIGQSQCIEYRYKQHLNYLKRNTNSRKLQEAYAFYGAPTLEILVECTIKELDSLENEAIEIFNSVNNGFNSLNKAGDIPIFVGDKHPSSKYSNEQVSYAFKLLVEGMLTHQQISDKTGVSKNMINHIAAGTCHLWLKTIYPEEYNLLEINKPTAGNSKARGKKYPKVISIEGISYDIENLRAFSREHNIPYSSLNSLVNYRTNNVRGWTLVQSV
jgi:hypothetical protein